MSGLAQAIPIIQAVAQVAEVVAEMVKAGASDEEIRERLSDPAGVGQSLIDACRKRKKKIDDFVEGK